MKKIILKIALFATLLLTSSISFSQEDPVINVPATIFSGAADGYYKSSFSNQIDPYTSFTKSNKSFELGMLSFNITHKKGKASFVADIGFGKRAKEFTYNDASEFYMVRQLNMSYEVSSTFKLTAGSFPTHIGYELVDAVLNKNYSMSYAFTYGPFFNTGLKAIYTPGKFNFMLGFVNPTDFKTAIEAGSNQKTFIGQIGYTGATGSAFLNMTSGSMNYNVGAANSLNTKNRTQFDLVATKKVSDDFGLGFNATYAIVNDDIDRTLDGNWFSVVGYASYQFKDVLSLHYRLEYFDDSDAVAAFVGGVGANVVCNTLSLDYKVGNLTLIPELRLDNASAGVYLDKNGNTSKSSGSILFATTYTF
ncbi:MAG: outer membrane beta-barrel protein [Flavobacterium sp.]